MKKALLTVLSIACLNVGAAFAQTSVMPKFGLTSHRMELTKSWESYNPTYNSGWVGGVAFNSPVTNVLSFQPELLLIKKGYGVDESDGNVHIAKNVSFNQIEVPLMFKYTLSASIFRFFFNFGPSVGYYLDGKYSETRSTDTRSREGSFQFRDGEMIRRGDSNFFAERVAVNRFDFGLQFGGGLGLKLGAGTLLFEARYGHGLTNLYQEQSGLFSGREASGQNRVFAYTVGYAIPVGD